jgi:hypothetical protein
MEQIDEEINQLLDKMDDGDAVIPEFKQFLKELMAKMYELGRIRERERIIKIIGE